MKLFTFLIIDDHIINDTKLFSKYELRRKNIKHNKYERACLDNNSTNNANILERNELKYLERNNKNPKEKVYLYERENVIYTYNDDKDIIFMRFRYPNIDKMLVPFRVRYNWAYTLIDNKKQELLKNVWTPRPDKKKKKIELANHEGKKRLQYLRDGGHIGNTKKMLHEHVLIINSKIKIEYRPDVYYSKDKNSGAVISERNINKKVILDSAGNEIKNAIIHHKGHSFDNRCKYLETVSISKHRLIHNKWEIREDNNFYRPKLIEFGEFFTDVLNCDCKISDKKERKSNCSGCNGILLIDTEDKLRDFISELTSEGYTKLEDKIIKI